MELVRQPVFLVLFTISTSVCILLAAVTYFGFGSNDVGREVEAFDKKLVENGALTVMFISGLFGAVLCASSSLAEEIRTGTALTVLSKPVSRVTFIIGKYLGLALALVVMCYANTIGVLLASRMSYDAYGNPDVLGTIIFFGAIFFAWQVAGMLNYFLKKQFVPWAVFLTLGAMTLAFLTLGAMDKQVAHIFLNHEIGHHANFADLWVWTQGMGYDATTGQVFTTADERWSKAGWFAGVNFGLLQASVLLLFALWILAAVALLCSTRLSWMPTLLICLGVFLMGLMSDYFFGKRALGGAFLTAGDTLVWSPTTATGTGTTEANAVENANRGVPDNAVTGDPELVQNEDQTWTAFVRWWQVSEEGTVRLFHMEPRGVQDLSRERVTVEVYLQSGNTELARNRLTNNVLTLYQATEEDAHTADSRAFLAGRECRVSFQSLKQEMAPLFIQRLLENEVQARKTAKELRDLFVEQGVDLDEAVFTGLIEDPSGIPEAARNIAEDIEYELDILFPGHLSFWVYPEVTPPGNGKLLFLAGEGGTGEDGRTIAEEVQRGSWWANVLYVLVPNWQLFWLADALGPGKTIPWSYVGRSLLYVLSYLGVALAMAFYLFEDRELS